MLASPPNPPYDRAVRRLLNEQFRQSPAGPWMKTAGIKTAMIKTACRDQGAA